MTTVNIATAKAHLSELVGKAEKGETIEIERHGKPVARLGPAEHPREPVDVDWLKTILDQLPETAAETTRHLREEGRY
ncbi:prevent-host-death family protein [Rhizobium rosettiformans]|jgi:prevent-host-death family protein|uniref:Antitoxin n=2 Tax=Rhizobium rosettiformans TaxID=1368430 RepID=A0A4S8Q503_9HYPH|nr:type II toxin-antitoxin system prevent-host-death family antitoxin [Rhizobium rosettiformans]MBA4797115.1 type II toxin-antitoxin system prevent-host-death family antitoxin [Hyphomicrobiales bacterium]MBB5276870.1 prevent-host-death family protein [Rhizobium rosettiformans]THV35294.1 type II toxin-antitoxin system prevent-host-death family antitoxin [Rhizobium rosettiformans W3]